jgi:demethylmenaquinone methyltransferase / 2-methoxy-6-polyprenyl-1,4-benzoquinol methylase
VRNKYLSYGEDRAPKVREMFSRLARRYDLVNDVMSFGMHRVWKRQTVRLALSSAPPSARVLDLCCGSGDLCFLAERMGAGSVIGADFTLPMLDVAQRRRKGNSGSRSGRDAGRPGPQFVQADALKLPFRDGSFDVVTIGYGLRNVADIPAALSEMRRVLAPGGRAVVLDFGKPDHALPAALYRAYLGTVMPAVGWIFHGDPQTYAYIPASLERYPAQRGVEALMREAGFGRVSYEERLLGTMGINVGEKTTPTGS